jgi:hypothetical protein
MLNHARWTAPLYAGLPVSMTLGGANFRKTACPYAVRRSQEVLVMCCRVRVVMLPPLCRGERDQPPLTLKT